MESIEELLKSLANLNFSIYNYTCQIDHYADLRDSAVDRKLKVLSQLAARYELRNTYDFRAYLDEHPLLKDQPSHTQKFGVSRERTLTQ
jgi:hypothetical protein